MIAASTWRSISAAALCVAGSTGSIARGQGEEHLHARLVAESASVAPGGTLYLGLLLDIEKGWHTYWPGQNDSGFPLKIDLKLPRGFEALPTQWPAPTRHIAPGDLLDHVYEGRVLVILPVKAPVDAPLGSTVRVTGETSFLVCEDACVPGKVPLSASFTIGSESKPSEDAKLFGPARDRLPAPLPKVGTVSAVWERDYLVISSKGAAVMAFYPHTDSAPISGLVASGRVEGPVLQLRPSGSDKPVKGVLEIRTGTKDAKPRYYSVNFVRPVDSVRPPSGPSAEPSDGARL